MLGKLRTGRCGCWPRWRKLPTRCFGKLFAVQAGQRLLFFIPNLRLPTGLPTKRAVFTALTGCTTPKANGRLLPKSGGKTPTITIKSPKTSSLSALTASTLIWAVRSKKSSSKGLARPLLKTRPWLPRSFARSRPEWRVKFPSASKPESASKPSLPRNGAVIFLGMIWRHLSCTGEPLKNFRK